MEIEMDFWNFRKYLQLVVLVVALLFTTGLSAFELSSHNTEICFSPHGGCTQAIVSQLRMAKS